MRDLVEVGDVDPLGYEIAAFVRPARRRRRLHHGAHARGRPTEGGRHSGRPRRRRGMGAEWITLDVPEADSASREAVAPRITSNSTGSNNTPLTHVEQSSWKPGCRLTSNFSRAPNTMSGIERYRGGHCLATFSALNGSSGHGQDRPRALYISGCRPGPSSIK